MFTCLSDRVSDVGGCEAIMTAGSRCGWVMFTECCE